MAKPLLNIHGKVETLCEYPTELKIPMDDGTIQTYVLANKTDIQFENMMHLIRRSINGSKYGGSFGKRNSRIHNRHCEHGKRPDI